jgi:hypothetical protein
MFSLPQLVLTFGSGVKRGGIRLTAMELSGIVFHRRVFAASRNTPLESKRDSVAGWQPALSRQLSVRQLHPGGQALSRMQHTAPILSLSIHYSSRAIRGKKKTIPSDSGASRDHSCADLFSPQMRFLQIPSEQVGGGRSRSVAPSREISREFCLEEERSLRDDWWGKRRHRFNPPETTRSAQQCFTGFFCGAA